MRPKRTTDDLAIFGGLSLFETPKSTSNLVRPDFDSFLSYSKRFYTQKQYTNNGPNVRLLEKRLAEFHRTKYCLTFCNGFWALVLTIKALALKGKTEIVMPSLTYRRMADIAAWANLKPIFCEVESKTLAMSADTVKSCINDDTALILGVHPIVNCCDIEGLTSFAKDNNIPLVFDSVESVYESTAGGKVGEFGDAEVFSMHASKLLNGFEGGYLTTNNVMLANQVASTRNFGIKGTDNVAVAGGMNANLCEIHASMALAGLEGLEKQIILNRKRYDTYKQLLVDIPGIKLLEFDVHFQSSFKNIVVELLEEWPLPRAETIKILNAENILARAYYSPPLHRKRMSYPFVEANLPLTEHLSEIFMNLPCGHFVDQNDIAEIVTVLGFIYTNADAIAERSRQLLGSGNV